MDVLYENLNDFHIDIYKNATYEMPFFHYHDCYEIFIITEGVRKMILHDHIYEGGKGDVFLVPAQYIHRTSGKGCERIVVNFSENFLSETFTSKMMSEILSCFDVFLISLDEKDLHELVNMCKLIMEKKDVYSSGVLSIKIVEVLLFLKERMYCNTGRKNQKVSEVLVSQILEYIHANYKTLSDIGTIADEFHLSKDYLSRIFKKHTQTTVMSYINSLKIDAARRILVGTCDRLSKIAEEVGISSELYLNKLFKATYGISPGKYRKENRDNKKQIDKDQL